MPVLSVHITSTLHKHLKQKAKEMGGLKMSDAVRILLQKALDGSHAGVEDSKSHQQLLHYSITSYYMLQSHLLNSFDEGKKLNDEAHKKSTKILESLFQKIKN